MKLHQFWSVLLLRRDGKKIKFKYLKRMAKSLNLTEYLHILKEEALQHRINALQYYNDLAEKGEELRKTHQEDVALAREQAGMEPIGKGLRIRQEREEQRRDH